MFKKKEKKIYKWKFLREGLKSEHGKTVWKIGEWKHEDSPSLCNSGFHCSDKVYQAFSYVKGEILAQVEVKGDSDIEDDKSSWSDMRVVKAYKWQKKDSVALSIFAAELCIKNYEKAYPNDMRPREAIEAAKKWLAEPTSANESAAESEAWAAESAWSAARSAARSARSAAESAAESATSAAESAARSAKNKVFSQIHKWMEDRVKTLELYED